MQAFKEYLIDAIVDRGVNYVATLIRNLTDGAERRLMEKQQPSLREGAPTALLEELSFEENERAEARFAELDVSGKKVIPVSSMPPLIQQALPNPPQQPPAQQPAVANAQSGSCDRR